ncbi:hypothetical protein [Brevundimonas nasdae]|uniref:Acyl-CoA transferase n=1 Tax=Brevundimonas nasdae TaxID=172043 RepID=A0ABX8TH70_9CAUL|nr:hypothetical protein [Brevundimonas nasdae]QYC10565.1 hypothetical protein KWG56_00635 [Brevundimonas nasdae]QYC13352.1 hypothetical protein KWG63_14190 [Brevundimonas nasdae]
MARHGEMVVQAVVAMAVAALPASKPERGAPWPERVGSGGKVIVQDGDPGEPEECFSPHAFTYRHTIPIEVFAPEGAADRFAALDAMLTALADRHASDISLNGLCNWSEIDAPSPDDVASAAAGPVRAAILTLTAEYTTTRRLG